MNTQSQDFQNLSIEHEADAQRQHVRVVLPGTAEINGKNYNLIDWSVAGTRVAISGNEANLFREGSVVDIKLMFSLDVFDLSLPAKAVVRNLSVEGGYVGLHFTDMNQRQLSVLRQMVNAYVSGEITSAGDLIHVVGRNNFTKSRELPKKSDTSFGEKASVAFRKLLLAGASIALFGYFITSVYERNYIVETSNAYVAARGSVIEAQNSGVAYFNNINTGDTVTKGQPLVTVQSNTGVVRTIDSPCDCVVSNISAAEGASVEAGNALLSLSGANTDLFIDGYITYEGATDIREGQTAYIALDGQKLSVKGMIEDISGQQLNGDYYKIRVVATEDIPARLVGTAAKVRVDTLGLVH